MLFIRAISQNDEFDEQKMLNLFIYDFYNKYNSIISNLFYGTLETKYQCLNCQTTKYNFQVCSIFQFPLEEINHYFFEKRKKINNNLSTNKNPDIDIYECFEYYESKKLMKEDNQLYCKICNHDCNMFKETIIYSAPNYLIIYLDRGKSCEYDSKVIFQEQLNLYNFVNFKKGNTSFELYAIICSPGPFENGYFNHMVAYCKNRIDKKWYLYNDGVVLKDDDADDYYKRCRPLFLFYKALKK